MANSIDLKKTVYNKDQFTKVIGNAREFSTFTEETEAPLLTVEDFFVAYDQLFFSINVEGETQSHRYLVNRSSELLTFDQTSNEFQVLLDEIAALRERLLNANINIVQLQTQLANNQLVPVVQAEPDLDIPTTTDDKTTPAVTPTPTPTPLPRPGGDRGGSGGSPSTTDSSNPDQELIGAKGRTDLNAGRLF